MRCRLCFSSGGASSVVMMTISTMAENSAASITPRLLPFAQENDQVKIEQVGQVADQNTQAEFSKHRRQPQLASTESPQQRHKQYAGYTEQYRRDRVAVQGVKLPGRCRGGRCPQCRQVQQATPVLKGAHVVGYVPDCCSADTRQRVILQFFQDTFTAQHGVQQYMPAGGIDRTDNGGLLALRQDSPALQ